MSIDQLATFITSALSLALLWIFYFWLYKRYIVDLFRQRMFVLRDELFDDAIDGVISADHDAYGTLRQTMNGFIRFAHQINLLEPILFILIGGRNTDKLLENESRSFDKRFALALNSLDSEAKAKMLSYKKEMQKLLIKHIFLTSPFITVVFFVPFFLLIVFAIIKKGLQGVKDFMFRKLNGLESAALAYGR